MQQQIQNGFFSRILEANQGVFPTKEITLGDVPESAGLIELRPVKAPEIIAPITCASYLYNIPVPRMLIGVSNTAGGVIEHETGTLLAWGPHGIPEKSYLPVFCHEFKHGLQGEVFDVQDQLFSVSGKTCQWLNHIAEFQSDIFMAIFTTPEIAIKTLNSTCVIKADNYLASKDIDPNDKAARDNVVRHYYNLVTHTHPSFAERVENVENFKGPWAEKVLAEAKEGDKDSMRSAIRSAMDRAPFHR